MSSNLHSAWASLFVRALVESGVRAMVLSPGSRSTPLALAAAQQPGLRVFTQVDERVAGFFALGITRATRAPVALLCTSGTAGAHWLPAVIEAAQAYHPLLLITADRPWEAYDCAAPQTVDQTELFGPYLRHRAELGLPDPAPEALRAVVRIAAQCAHHATWPTPGPVHVNARFRKPLEPVAPSAPEAWRETLRSLSAPRVFTQSTAPDDAVVEALAARIEGSPEGVICCGPSAGGAVFRRAGALAERVGYPLLAEATSGARFGVRAELPGRGLDLALRSARFRAAHAPTLAIELGLPAVSSSYATWIAGHPAVERWVVAPHGWPDPLGGCAARVFADARLLDALIARAPRRARGPWASDFTEADALVRARVEEALRDTALHELSVASLLVERLRDGDALFVGNSMPVRDVDVFTRSEAQVEVLHQRGASGIDGAVAGVAGVRAAWSPAARVCALLGDITMLHDLGGLNAARHADAPLVIVVVQNDGGRIFAQLPLARQRGDVEVGRAFEAHFITAQGLSFEGAAGMFGVAYRRVDTRSGYERALDEALARAGATLIEAVVPPEDAAARRAALSAAIAADLDARW